MWLKSETKADSIFKVSIFLKAVDGAFEVIGGLLFLLVKPADLAHLVAAITQHELSQDPNDFLATHILHSAQHLTTATSVFAGLYLLSHGLTKIVLVTEILRDHLWAFRGMMIFLILSILYQTYRMFYKPSWGLLLLTIFDAFILYLTTREERKVRLTHKDT